MAARLHTLAVDARGALVGARLLLAAVVDVDDVEGVDVAGDVAEEREADVDKHVGAAACDDDDTHGGDCGEGLVGRGLEGEREGAGRVESLTEEGDEDEEDEAADVGHCCC